MKIPPSKWLAFLACLVAAPVGATSEHDYKKNEYPVIRHGLAPNKQHSLASHGAGENNDDAFHVWLMAEPGHRRIATLDDISADNNLDNAPDAYHAFWSKDSRRVGVAFRGDRHEVTLNLYRVENSRAHLITGPSLFKEVTSRNVKSEDGLRQLNAIVEWHGGNASCCGNVAPLSPMTTALPGCLAGTGAWRTSSTAAGSISNSSPMPSANGCRETAIASSTSSPASPAIPTTGGTRRNVALRARQRWYAFVSSGTG
jgi:hypothetical protein